MRDKVKKIFISALGKCRGRLERLIVGV